ncbi:BAX inhibitor protein [Gammaproteobacteria bacterium 45_16_T64]|nr:BAX inhibitor protein [Gammaproteobacteria bacterium 45_16_T64]
MQNNPYAAPELTGQQDSVAINKVLRNTYMLLGMTIIFSSIVAGVAMAMNAPYPNIIVLLVGFYGLLFAIHKTQNSPMGLVLTFVFTGFLGYTLGPIFNMFLSIPGGSNIITMALGMTGMTFLSLSAYAVVSKKDFSFLTGFLTAGFWIILVAVIANIFLQMPVLSLAISGFFVLFSSAMILWQTGQIINGGERNYVLATISLYVSIYNLLLSLMSILTAFSGDD